MKSCNRCGRNLEKTGHSLSCPVGQFIKQIDSGNGNANIRIAFPDDGLKKEFGDMMARTAQTMLAVKNFYAQVVELDEDAPNLTEDVAPFLEKLITDLILIYPNMNQFDADLKTLLGQVEE